MASWSDIAANLDQLEKLDEATLDEYSKVMPPLSHNPNFNRQFDQAQLRIRRRLDQIALERASQHNSNKHHDKAGGMYNLTPGQRELLRCIVEKVRAKEIPEEFTFMPGFPRGGFLSHRGSHRVLSLPGVSEGALDALAADHLLHVRNKRGDKFGTRYCTLTGNAYEAVDSNFAAPDTSFVRHLTPLADITTLDIELKDRCLPILGAGSADRKLWDSAVRTAGVILEERLRDVGMIEDAHTVGQDLVNKVFSKTGTLADRFPEDAERQGHRDLYAGVIAAFRNPSAHRLVDPEPHEGGAYIVFANLLLKKLEDLRQD